MNKINYKKEKLYNPPTTPIIVDIPKIKYITVEGNGDPNTSKQYKDAIEILYSLSYTIKMKGKHLDGYTEYTVFPLEGLWTSKNPIFNYDNINKDDFIWLSMIRQPDFVTEKVFNWAKEELHKKKPDLNLDNVKFEELEEGTCIQIMHIGSYDDEKRSFLLIEKFLKENNYKKKNDKYHHHEIYMSDPRKVNKDKLKTILRCKIEK